VGTALAALAGLLAQGPGLWDPRRQLGGDDQVRVTAEALLLFGALVALLVGAMLAVRCRDPWNAVIDYPMRRGRRRARNTASAQATSSSSRITRSGRVGTRRRICARSWPASVVLPFTVVGGVWFSNVEIVVAVS
jgi:hypothetical protein